MYITFLKQLLILLLYFIIYPAKVIYSLIFVEHSLGILSIFLKKEIHLLYLIIGKFQNYR